MPNKLAHFAIDAEDVERARAFYESVFDWQFEAWGPPEFYLIRNAGTHGALQKRTGPSVPGRHGFECSIAVDDLSASMAAIKKAGGRINGAPHTIPTVGELVSFRDTEGNQAIIVQYEAEAQKALAL
ncbi:MAG: glyoxalase [Robiginitomaculum sp.]|nr:MAG: glyoxalase [Robiginitomaculum sp.]